MAGILSEHEMETKYLWHSSVYRDNMDYKLAREELAAGLGQPVLEALTQSSWMPTWQ